MSDTSHWLSQQKGRWREWVGWLIWIGYLAFLFWMASVYWHVHKVYIFVGIFLGLPLLIAIAFKLMYEGSGKQIDE